MSILLFKGCLIGFAIAAVVGPIGILCIQRTLHQGLKVGLMTGLGATFADTVYGLIAAFGLTTVSSFLMTYQSCIKLIGGFFLLYLGVTIWLTRPPQEAVKSKPAYSSSQACLTTFFLTLTNPITILSFMAIFAGLGLGNNKFNYQDAVLLVIGITIGSGLWWLFLSVTVSLIHHRISPAMMRLINGVSGLIIVGFGILAILS